MLNVMENYENKFNYIYNRQRGYCLRCMDFGNVMKNVYYSKTLIHLNIWSGYEFNRMTEFQHRCHNTKWRRKAFPLFIDSMFNLVGYCNKCNTNDTSSLKITDEKAARYERFLERHPQIARFVNGIY